MEQKALLVLDEDEWVLVTDDDDPERSGERGSGSA